MGHIDETPSEELGATSSGNGTETLRVQQDTHHHQRRQLSKRARARVGVFGLGDEGAGTYLGASLLYPGISRNKGDNVANFTARRQVATPAKNGTSRQFF